MTIACFLSDQTGPSWFVGSEKFRIQKKKRQQFLLQWPSGSHRCCDHTPILKVKNGFLTEVMFKNIRNQHRSVQSVIWTSDVWIRKSLQRLLSLPFASKWDFCIQKTFKTKSSKLTFLNICARHHEDLWRMPRHHEDKSHQTLAESPGGKFWIWGWKVHPSLFTRKDVHKNAKERKGTNDFNKMTSQNDDTTWCTCRKMIQHLLCERCRKHLTHVSCLSRIVNETCRSQHTQFSTIETSQAPSSLPVFNLLIARVSQLLSFTAIG